MTKPNHSPQTQRYPQIGDQVLVAQKKDYANGKLTAGTVAQVLTKKKFHPRGHKVRLQSGIVGRVQKFVTKSDNQTLPPPIVKKLY